MTLETPRLNLTLWRPGDGAEFHRIWGDPRVIFWGAAQDLAASEAVLARVIDRCADAPEPCGWYALRTQGGGLVGNALLQPTPSLPGDLEIGWHLAAAHQGHGYATEAARALLDHAFARLDIPRVVALIMPSNAPSARVAERLGMRRGERIIHAGEPHDVWSADRRSYVG